MAVYAIEQYCFGASGVLDRWCRGTEAWRRIWNAILHYIYIYIYMNLLVQLININQQMQGMNIKTINFN